MLELFAPVFHAAQGLVTYLGANPILLAILTLLAAPYVDKFLIRRKGVTYWTINDARVGVIPETLPEGNLGGAEGLRRFVRMLERMSKVDLRVRNTGGSEIRLGDWIEALEFDFSPRVVWNARVSKPSDDRLRDVERGLRFASPREPGHPPDLDISLDELRRRMVTRLVGANAGPHYSAVRLSPFSIGRRQQFTLSVVLIEPGEDGGPIKFTTGFTQNFGALRDGVVRDGGRPHPITLRRATGVLAAGLTALLVLGSVAPQPKLPEPNTACRPGQLTVEGSTVFMPTMKIIADQYAGACPEAKIATVPNGSVNGVRDVSNDHVAVTDGKQNTTQPGLHAEALAVVVYDVVVNSSAGVNGLTTAQLQGIYNGTYRDWNQLRGGASLPIRIVGRDYGSGSRELFEQSVLHVGEPGLTSNGCLTLDRGVQASVIRCERDNNAQEIQTISQTPGAIGYSDAPSAASARKSNAVTALTIDNKAFDINTAVESGYPFWTVEYFYSLGEPASNTLVGALVDYLRISDSVHARLAEAGYVPCARQAGAMLDLCNRR